MTFHWNTSVVVNSLGALPGVSKIIVTPPGGDYDSDGLVVHGKGRSKIYVCAYDSTEEFPGNTSDMQAQFIEINDGLDSRGGLNSKSKDMIELYAELLKFFADHDVEVIDSCDEIF